MFDRVFRLLALSLLPLAGLVCAAQSPPSTDSTATDCGLVPEVIPDFSLEDVNETSPTVGQTLSRDQLLGQVLVMYWAQAT